MTELHDAMRAAGFDPPTSIEPGRVVRFPTNGKRSDRSGWCYLFPDSDGATFGDWRTGREHTWQAKRDTRVTAAERAELRRKAKQAKREANAQREREHQGAASSARAIWAGARSAPASHAYLTRKKVAQEGLRLATDGDYKGWLIAPVHGADGGIQSLQYIAHDGAKRF
jgi:putative DNA primase/helicase